MAHGDVREVKWRGNWRMEWVASTLHTTSEHGVSSITSADAHTSAASSRLKLHPRWFKWTRPFRQKTKSGFCACAITFQLATTGTFKFVESSWNVMELGDALEGKWRGNWRMKWVASTLHTTSEHGVSSITSADAHTSAASSRLNWRPRRFKWTRPFRRKTKSGFSAPAFTFQTQSTSTYRIESDNCPDCPVLGDIIKELGIHKQAHMVRFTLTIV